jgi:formate hydrogenlyase transcriptional activator
LYALEPGPIDDATPLGMEIPFRNTAIAQVLETQQPKFISDPRAEMDKVPGFPEDLKQTEIQSLYVFPVSSSRGSLGVMSFGSTTRQTYSAADLELMGAVVAHVSAMLEGALALESAESYRVELERERDRLNLLLEINNHIVNYLDVNELFRAASASIREFINIAFSGFWLFEEGSNQLQCVTLDFPGSQGAIEHIPVPQLSEKEIAPWSMRVPTVLHSREIEKLPAFISRPLRAESIACIVCVPLIGSSRPLGMILLGSKEEDILGRMDLELLLQVGNQISLALENAVAYRRLNRSHRRLEDERLYLESELQSEYNFEDIIGSSGALKKVLETGTGKELIARAIHNHSARHDRTFVRMNCATIPQGLLESELFGHEKGAFTGALTQKRGRLELANEGTLFLDEVGDIDLSLQPKLLRVLQEREFERLGSNCTTKVDVRLLAATNRNLMEMIGEGKFREDLYYRLNVFPIHIPPLRERKEDIPLLVHYFVDQLSRKMRKNIRMVPRGALEAMMNWSWPGNVRELQNFIERSVILTRGETLAAPIAELRKHEKNAVKIAPLPATDRDAILEALRASRGRMAGAGGAAERLGLKRTTLLKRMARLNISRQDFN